MYGQILAERVSVLSQRMKACNSCELHVCYRCPVIPALTCLRHVTIT